MNDQVNKVIAAILNADNTMEGGASAIEGGKRRSKSKSRSKVHHGIKHNVRRLMNKKLHGGDESSNAKLEGGSCGSVIKAGRYDSVFMQAGSTEQQAVETQEPIVGGAKKRRSSKRKLPAALKRQNSYTMSRYSQIKRQHPDWAGNEVLAEAMKSGSHKRFVRNRKHHKK